MTPEVVGGAPIELLAGIQYAKLVGGLGRDELYLDLLEPVSERPTPVILFVLGCGWALVEPKRVLRSRYLWRKQATPSPRLIYRGNGETRFPYPEADIKAAIRSLRANADLCDIDAGDIGVMGNSAGGHLSLMTVLTRT